MTTLISNLQLDLDDNNWANTRGCGTRVQAAPPRNRGGALRSYFRLLRAAEMAAWDATGGDYVLASFIPARAGANQ